MYRILPTAFIVFIALFTVTQAVAQSPLQIKTQAPKIYTVEKGDTLWDISQLYLANPWLWPRLWQANPEINNPHLIYPGDKLNLIWRNGEPMLSLKPMVKLSPKVRVIDKQALTTVKQGLLLPYLEFDRLLDLSTLKGAERVLGASHGNKYLTKNEWLFISGAQQQTKWGIYRQMDTYSRGEQKMVALKQIALGDLQQSEDEMSALQITQQTQEILVDDIALPLGDSEKNSLSTHFFPHPSPSQESVQILGAIEGSDYVGKNQVVVIDRGLEDSLAQGSMFELYQPSKLVKADSDASPVVEKAALEKWQLPNLRIGSLMVIRPYPHFSLALVTESQQPISKQTLVQAPNVTVTESGEDKVATAKVVGSEEEQ